jgi:undecaprenyl-diphosphatase
MMMLAWGQGPLDRQLYEAFYAGNRPALIPVARFFTALGEPTVLVGAGFLVAGWLWRQKRWRLGVALLLVTLVGRGLSEVQKYTIARRSSRTWSWSRPRLSRAATRRAP